MIKISSKRAALILNAFFKDGENFQRITDYGGEGIQEIPMFLIFHGERLRQFFSFPMIMVIGVYTDDMANGAHSRHTHDP